MKYVWEIFRFKGRPANDTTNDWRSVSAFEQPASLVERLACLYGDRSIDVCSLKLAFKIVYQKVAAQCRHAVVNPAKLGCAILPQMMMCIDSLCGWRAERLHRLALR